MPARGSRCITCGIATETATALFLAGTYAGASARLEGLAWGAEDLSAELGAQATPVLVVDGPRCEDDAAKVHDGFWV